MDFVEAIRVRALLDMTEEQFAYSYRKVCRWFSHTFHTPLHEVEDLPLEYVLQHYFESLYENMDEGDFEQTLEEVIESPEEKTERLKAEEAKSDEAFLRRAQEESKKSIQVKQDKTKKLLEQAAKTLKEIGDKEMVALPEPPDISMSFDDSGNLNEVREEDPYPWPPDEDTIPAPPRK